MRPFSCICLVRKFVRSAGPLVLLAAALVGCSLSDYERAMDAQQLRMDYMDELEKAVTAEPITWPPKKEGDKTALSQSEIFFRPLAGISTTWEKPGAEKLPLNRYRSTVKSLAFKDVLVNAAKTKTLEEFKKDTLKALGMSNSPPKPKLEVGKELGEPMEFEFYHDDRAGSPYVYFRSDQACQVAIVYRPAQGATAGALKQMEPIINYSLATLALGPMANKKIATRKPAPGTKPAPKTNVAPSTGSASS